MNHLNNHFQKGIIILVIAILIISSMHTYSSVGSYQTSSFAMRANNKYEHSHKDDGFYWGSAAFVLGVIGAVSAAIVSLAVINYLSDRTNGNETLLYESFVNDEIMYAKHDFSKFDN